MSVFKKIWRDTNDPSPKRFEIKVDEIPEEQPENPYTEVTILQQHNDFVRQLLIIDDSRCISVGDDHLAVVWNYQLCVKLCLLSGHTRPITCVLKVPQTDGVIWVLTGSSDKTLRVWDIDQGKCLQVLSEHGSSVKCLLAIRKDNFLSGGQSLHLWSAQGRLLSAFDREKEEDISMMIHIMGYRERFVTAAGKLLSAYDIQTKNEEDSEEGEIFFVKTLKSTEEEVRQLINIDDNFFACGLLDGRIIIWSSQTLSLVQSISLASDYKMNKNCYPYSIQYMCCEHERYLLAAVGAGFSILDVISKKVLCQKIKAHHSNVRYMTLVADGYLLATCSEDGTIRLWSMNANLSSAADESKTSMRIKYIERFFDMSFPQLLACKCPLSDPVLVGECQAHSEAVQMVLDLGWEGMISCGMDGLVIIWKNAELQITKRNQLLQDSFLNVQPQGII